MHQQLSQRTKTLTLLAASLLVSLLAHLSLALPQNFTHRVEVAVSVDGKVRGRLQIGLYAQNASLAVHNFLAQCDDRYKSSPAFDGARLNARLRAKNITDADQFSLVGKPVTYVLHGEYLKFGAPAGEDVTVYGDKWQSEQNDFATEVGALVQEREIPNGRVGSRYTICFKRMQFDGRYSPWLVFGDVYGGRDLLEYISHTAGDNNGEPRREVAIHSCRLILREGQAIDVLHPEPVSE